MNMREKIARLYAGRALNEFGDAESVVWNGLCNHDREIAFRHADAVLEAMREPTEEQLIEAQRAMFNATQSAPPSTAIAIGYTAMIDAARQ